MEEAFDQLRPHRQLVWHLETALDCLDAAVELDGFLPHFAQRQVRQMAADLESLLERVGREVPALAPLGDDELGDAAT